MSDDEGFDIAGSLALAAKNDASDSGFSSDSGSDSDAFSDNEELQDIISDDEDEAEDQLPAKKKQKVTKLSEKLAMPSMELSDDEELGKKDSQDIASYFAVNNPTAKKAKAGTFASFGLSKFILGNIARKGYKQPTPIQRKTIPLIMENRDVVGMARTGSGKTAAFTLPVIEKLKAHYAKVGARAVILSPSRELALQTFKQVKEFSKGTDLRSVVLIGGDAMEEQFSSMMSNPDIIVATPGRFLHLKVEMDLDLRTVEYIVFDEADRLFEMGFAEQLNELLAALPLNRQSLLFSATLPRSLIDFAKAGLTNPVLIRLDAETKISELLQMGFFSVKKTEREAALLCIIQNVIKIPLPSPEELARIKRESKRADDVTDDEDDNHDASKKRKKFKKERLPPANVLPSPHSTIVFVPTKHHVEFVTQMLREAGFLVSYIYGSLDQRARREQLYRFRIGLTNLLVVTDVAARGIDIPVLANVINFTLPASSKIFIHRVGRTARAGNKGWAYSIVSESELPYLLDIELFLGKKILLTSMHEKKCELLKAQKGDNYVEPKISYTDRMVLGALPRDQLEPVEEMYNTLIKSNYDLKVIKDVAVKGERLYYRTRQAASAESVKRSKELLQTGSWDEQHLLFGPNMEKEKDNFLAKLQNRRVKETVFEFTKKGKEKEEDSMVTLMNRRRRQLAPIQRKAKERRELLEQERLAGLSHTVQDEILKGESGEVGYNVVDIEADDDELANAFEDGDSVLHQKQKQKKKSYRDPQFFISHHAPASEIQDQQFSVPNSFANDAAKATFDLENDDKLQKNSQVMKWDKKKGKYINSQSVEGKKYIIGESGQRIPATFKSGKFDHWKKQRNIGAFGAAVSEEQNNEKGSRRFKHKKVDAPRAPDKYRDDYHKQKKKVDKAVESGRKVKGFNKPGQRQELRSTEDIRKSRQLMEKKQAKNGRGGRRR
ncbi:ATP-dependent RNA helicase DBP10 [Metschnikowia bicuspidata var. bicuspidata NRRL YB-4993]|uniref:ATP-dependent RNA helicase DBP10 n=1 Tax=Metschnikowia bicuspidata var. bicuspidata NRRL YB-4993 TaxID=869754 RepID=A0A1A0HHY8_9ASCO|nr:ATP-dependent RNA helicase DBP10 [Metschnikowia bicuspidata var. bicuspidata NRRL YB-4993]OBA23458.1 ATP-dependent RNA helicase DBP10 [Metschnikowia bicuspidata var. bicuspidata NRRL YB-4993]